MNFERDGAALLVGAAVSILPALDAFATNYSPDCVGIRLHGDPVLASLTITGGLLQAIAAERLGSDARVVRAILFDKSPRVNWALGWHQDRTIAVRQRAECTGFGSWTVKSNIHHVAPPFTLLERMVTMRIHLDPAAADNAPLLIALGSHRLGRVAETAIEDTVARCGTAICLAARGDVWLYATPIVHASDRSTADLRRRVLQLDFSADALPEPLEWLGV